MKEIAAVQPENNKRLQKLLNEPRSFTDPISGRTNTVVLSDPILIGAGRMANVYDVRVRPVLRNGKIADHGNHRMALKVLRDTVERSECIDIAELLALSENTTLTLNEIDSSVDDPDDPEKVSALTQILNSYRGYHAANLNSHPTYRYTDTDGVQALLMTNLTTKDRICLGDNDGSSSLLDFGEELLTTVTDEQLQHLFETGKAWINSFDAARKENSVDAYFFSIDRNPNDRMFSLMTSDYDLLHDYPEGEEKVYLADGTTIVMKGAKVGLTNNIRIVSGALANFIQRNFALELSDGSPKPGEAMIYALEKLNIFFGAMAEQAGVPFEQHTLNSRILAYMAEKIRTRTRTKSGTVKRVDSSVSPEEQGGDSASSEQGVA